eukprot:1563002-Rhodomonas_salina.1
MFIRRPDEPARRRARSAGDRLSPETVSAVGNPVEVVMRLPRSRKNQDVGPTHCTLHPTA